MRHSLWEQRIPTLMAMVLLVVGIIATSFLTRNAAIFRGNASASQDPQNVRVTNITDTSFTVSYTTSEQVTGSLLYGTTSDPKTEILDDRDGQAVAPHLLHYITVKNLTPTTKYFFAIVSGSTTYTSSTATQPFEVSTGPTLASSSSKMATGSLIVPQGSAPKEAIVYAESDGTISVSTLVNQDGTYQLPVGLIRTTDLSHLVDLQVQDLTVLATSGELSSRALLSAQTTEIPLMILSNDYDFSVSSAPLSSTSSAFLGFPSLPATPSANSPKIITPKQNETFSDQQPLFTGTASPNSNVQITIQSTDEITTQVQSDQNGNWSYRPTTPLAPGQHTLTIKAPDKSGILQILTQSFVVFASGSQVGQSATPSATPTFVPTSVPTATPIPTFTPTPTPTAVPTIIITHPSPPITGDSSAIKGGLLALGMTIVGLLLFAATRGRISL